MKANESMLCWNEETKDVKIVRWPDHGDHSRGYSSVGADHVAFREMTKEQKQIALIGEGLWIAHKHAIPVGQVYAALLEIDECREVLKDDPFRA